MYVTSECGCQFYSREFNNNECQYKCKKPIKHCICKQDFASNSGIRGCECDKDCEFGEKKTWTCMKISNRVFTILCGRHCVKHCMNHAVV